MNTPAFDFKNLWKPFLIAAALAFVYATVLAKLGFDWWTDENYSHGLLVPFVIGYIIYLEFDELKKIVSKPAVLFGGAMILFALVLLLGGTLGAELFTQRISFVVMLAGIVVYFFGAKILKSLVVPFVLLLLAIPIPQIIFNKIAFPLQIFASQMAVWGIRLFEVPSVRKGNVIEILPSGATQVIALEVVEACSGIRSLMTLVTLALILAYFTRSKKQSVEGKSFVFLKNFDFWQAVVLMLAAIPIAVFTNAARVTGTGVLTYYYGKRAAEGTIHDSSGWLVYVVALALLIALNFVLKKFSVQNTEKLFENPQSVSNADRPGGSPECVSLSAQTARRICVGERDAHRTVVGTTALPMLTALIIGGIFINWLNQRGEAEVSRRPLSEIASNLGNWRQKGDAIRFDAATESVLRTTDYTMREFISKEERLANLYVGYYASQRTGATYHSPQNCLPGAGWVMRQPQFIEIKTLLGKTFTANKFIVENGVHTEVLIYWYQGRGRSEASEYADKINTVWDSITRRRSDGAMVRVMTSVGIDEAGATAAAVDLAANTADKLADFVPE